MHRDQLVALVRRAKNIVSVTLLNLDVEEPDGRRKKGEADVEEVQQSRQTPRSSPFPAGSAELVAAGHVHRVLKDGDGAEADSTLHERKHLTKIRY